MKITKKQLKRIIKEEKARLLSEMKNKNVEEGIARGVMEGVWNWIEEEFSQDMIGESAPIGDHIKEKRGMMKSCKKTLLLHRLAYSRIHSSKLC